MIEAVLLLACLFGGVVWLKNRMRGIAMIVFLILLGQLLFTDKGHHALDVLMHPHGHQVAMPPLPLTELPKTKGILLELEKR